MNMFGITITNLTFQLNLKREQGISFPPLIWSEPKGKQLQSTIVLFTMKNLVNYNHITLQLEFQKK